MDNSRHNQNWNLFQFYRNEEVKARNAGDESQRLHEQRKRRILCKRLTEAEVDSNEP